MHGNMKSSGRTFEGHAREVEPIKIDLLRLAISLLFMIHIFS